jgi:hypothetical protein
VNREKGEVILIFRVFFAIESEVFVPIINARIFDGESILDGKTVVIEGQNILAVSDEMPEGATLIDASGATLLPGLIDSHVHTNMRLALTFGVTTELEMMGHWTPEQRKEVAESDDMADLRTAEFGLTAPGGHPSELHGPRGGKGRGGPPPGAGSGSKPPEHGHRHGFEAPNATNPEEAIKFVAARIADGAD